MWPTQCINDLTSYVSHLIKYLVMERRFRTRMHSSSMRTTHNSSRLLGGSLPQCILGYPQVWAWRPPLGCGPGDPLLGVDLETPRYGPGDPPGAGLETPWPDPSTSPLGVGLETCKACWDTTHPPRDLQDMLGYLLQCMLGSPCEQNDRQVQKYYLAPNFVCGW